MNKREIGLLVLYFCILNVGNILIDVGQGYVTTLGYAINGGLMGHLVFYR